MRFRLKGSIPDPGPLPFRPSPEPNDRIRFQVSGLPPDKDLHFSIRNPKHRRHCRFKELRGAAIAAMAGRARYSGPIQLNVEILARELDRSLPEYLGGIMDTLDGSHAPSFTYLPVVYQDDCQVVSASVGYEPAQDDSYVVEIIFFDEEWRPVPSKALGDGISIESADA